MLPASVYQPIYLLVVTLLTFFACSLYAGRVKFLRSDSAGKSQFMAFLLMAAAVLFVGTRPVSEQYFVDMDSYSSHYSLHFGDTFWFSWDVDNLIWDNLFNWMASKGIPFSDWLLLVALAYFGLMYLACRKLFGGDVLMAYVVYLGAFSTFSYGTNGMKAGVAASLFMVAMAYRDRLIISVPIALLTYGFHHSMALVVTAYIVVLLVRNPKYYFAVWAVSFVMAALHITFFQTFFARYTDENGAEYLLSSRNSGFRLDFFLYSAVPVFIGYWMLYRYRLQLQMYSFLLNLYIMTNSLWMLCMYANFNNRIAYLSWFMYPVVLIYPFLKHFGHSTHNRYLFTVVGYHLLFTLFMTFFYYA